jgi:hypothetical protein
MTRRRRFLARPWTAGGRRASAIVRKNGVHPRSIALHMKRTPTELRRHANRLNILLRQMCSAIILTSRDRVLPKNINNLSVSERAVDEFALIASFHRKQGL